MIRKRHQNTETLPDHPPEFTCAPLVLGMASPAWAVTELTGFKDPDGNPCELRARLGAKVIFHLVPGNTFKANASDLVFEELSPRSSTRPPASQGPLELRTPVTVPREFHTHLSQHKSVFPGDLIVRSAAAQGDSTRELVLADLFDRHPAVVDALRRHVFDRTSSRDMREPLPWFGTRCAFLSIRTRVFLFVADAMHLLPCMIGAQLRRPPMAGPSPGRSSACILLSSSTQKHAGLLYKYPPPPLACGGQSPSPACGGQLSSSQLPVLCLPSRYGLFSDDDAPVMKAIDLVEFVAGEGAVTVWTKLFGVRCLCC